MSKADNFAADLRNVINTHGIDTYLNLPDHTIVKYLISSLRALKKDQKNLKPPKGNTDEQP